MHTVTSKGHAVKSASLQRGAAAPSDRASMLCTCVYISEQTLGWGSKRSKTTERTKCSTDTQTHHIISMWKVLCWWCSDWGCDGWFDIVLCCGTVFGSVRVTLPAPCPCGGAWYAGSSPTVVGNLLNRSRSGVDSLLCEWKSHVSWNPKRRRCCSHSTGTGRFSFPSVLCQSRQSRCWLSWLHWL